ncbi:MAG: hypothetical protein LC777_07740, partial [Actinobacteria bacterium]|nr:hypothetical protein [Actinomycetota bacterium]
GEPALARRGHFGAACELAGDPVSPTITLGEPNFPIFPSLLDFGTFLGCEPPGQRFCGDGDEVTYGVARWSVAAPPQLL